LLSGFVAGTAISGNVVGNNSWGIYVNSVNMPTDPTASQHNFVQNNTASNNKYYGIQMRYGAIGNTVQTNVALGNAVQSPNHYEISADLADDNVSPCANTWINNTFVSASGFGASCIH
ncbi:MAG: hypothetical protein DMG16_25310, partial [Acidobacteria bacterium]